MPTYPFAAPAQPDLPIVGSDLRYPVRRIFCVGRNDEAHAAEMGNVVDREAPFYFTKSAYALLQSGQDMPYPPARPICTTWLNWSSALAHPLSASTPTRRCRLSLAMVSVLI